MRFQTQPRKMMKEFQQGASEEHHGGAPTVDVSKWGLLRGHSEAEPKKASRAWRVHQARRLKNTDWKA